MIVPKTSSFAPLRDALAATVAVGATVALVLAVVGKR
jgi:hypothetical protein